MVSFPKKLNPAHSGAQGSQRLNATALEAIRKECKSLLEEYGLQKRRTKEIESPKFPGRMRNSFLLFGGNVAQILLCNGGAGRGRVSVKEMGETLNLVFENSGTRAITGEITVTFDGLFCRSGKIEPTADAISGEVTRILMNMLA